MPRRNPLSKNVLSRNPWRAYHADGLEEIGFQKGRFPEVGTIRLTFDYSTQNGALAYIDVNEKIESTSTNSSRRSWRPEWSESILQIPVAFVFKVCQRRCGRVEVSLPGREWCLKKRIEQLPGGFSSRYQWDERGIITVEPRWAALAHWGEPKQQVISAIQSGKLGAPGDFGEGWTVRYLTLRLATRVG